jgi:hypothetical protein
MVDGFRGDFNNEWGRGNPASLGSSNPSNSGVGFEEDPEPKKRTWVTPELRELLPGTKAHARAQAALSKST